ncbi:hypothetical protein AB0I81_22405 [Nonomuraea sp. NPDC050404]|uniref:hypothetical protein n=1 Tax=Nonomuraea sp. NPDC050404 TaxID=3155783 RepID=UPI0033E43F31
MLDDIARVTNYFEQTGRSRLTARQHRRVNRKRAHQSQEAQDRRDSVTRARIAAALAGARRRDPLPA